jgi:hypothetical protein
MNHIFGFRDHLGPSGHPSEAVSRLGMISFNRRGVGFANDMTLLREHLGKRVPAVCIKYTIRYMVNFIIESLERCRITTTEYPGNGSPCATIHGFNNPDFSFVDCIKCHISSHSTSRIFGAIVGSSVLAAACRIQSYVVVRETPNSLAKKPHEAFPRE